MSSKRESPFSDAKREKAAAERFYIRAGPKRGHLYLSGAVAMWKKDPTVVYVPTLRTVGRPADILKAFEGMYEADAVQQHINAGYRAGSEAGADFVAEVEDLKAYRAGAPKVAAKRQALVLPHNAAWYAARVDEAVVEGGKAKSPRKPRKSASPKKKAAKKSKSASPKRAKKSKSASPKKAAKKGASPKGGKRGARALSDKLANLSAGKVMDVTKYRADGSGAKVIDAPSNSARSKKRKSVV